MDGCSSPRTLAPKTVVHYHHYMDHFYQWNGMNLTVTLLKTIHPFCMPALGCRDPAVCVYTQKPNRSLGALYMKHKFLSSRKKLGEKSFVSASSPSIMFLRPFQFQHAMAQAANQLQQIQKKGSGSGGGGGAGKNSGGGGGGGHGGNGGGGSKSLLGIDRNHRLGGGFQLGGPDREHRTQPTKAQLTMPSVLQQQGGRFNPKGGPPSLLGGPNPFAVRDSAKRLSRFRTNFSRSRSRADRRG